MNRNGPIIKYKIIFTDVMGQKPRRYKGRGSGKSQYTLQDITSAEPGYITIKAGTKVGMSEASSRISIPKVSGE